jgi:hypothetical protein
MRGRPSVIEELGKQLNADSTASAQKAEKAEMYKLRAAGETRAQLGEKRQP